MEHVTLFCILLKITWNIGFPKFCNWRIQNCVVSSLKEDLENVSMKADYFSHGRVIKHLVSPELHCVTNLLCIQTVFVTHSLPYFTILYPKHKYLAENEFPQDTKKLGPISNSRQVFSKEINLDFQAQIRNTFQTLMCVQTIWGFR